jgi:antitoxin ParD1/3/4
MSRTVQISLPEELAAVVASAVANGEYASESDAILDAVVEWETQRLSETISVEELCSAWREGVESGPGRSMSIEEIKAEARRRHGAA